MTRRAFIASLSCIAAVWPPWYASAQDHGRSYRLGILVQAPRNAAYWAAFFDEMRKNGYVQGSNLSVIDGFDTPVGTADKVAKAIVAQRPDVILTAGVFTTVVQKATQVIPILTVSDDLLAEHAVASLAHPEGNTTGISILATELDRKRQEILLEAVPSAHCLAILVDPSVTSEERLEGLTEAASAQGVAVAVRQVTDAANIELAMDAMVAAGAQALNVPASSLLNRNRGRIIAHAAALRLPAIFQWPEMAEEGGLVAYGPRFVTLYRQHARQVQKMLEGASPPDIPVEQPTKFELVINLRTAKAFGLNVPQSLLARADEVVE